MAAAYSMLQVVSNRNAAGTQQYAQYTTRHHQAPRGYAYPPIEGTKPQQAGVKFTERGVPEGAASAPQTDCNKIMSPTGANGNGNVGAGGSLAGQIQQQGTTATSTAATTTSTAQGAVFYAMNV